MPMYDCVQQFRDFVNLCRRTYLHVLVCANILVAYAHTCVSMCVCGVGGFYASPPPPSSLHCNKQ